MIDIFVLPPPFCSYKMLMTAEMFLLNPLLNPSNKNLRNSRLGGWKWLTPFSWNRDCVWQRHLRWHIEIPAENFNAEKLFIWFRLSIALRECNETYCSKFYTELFRLRFENHGFDYIFDKNRNSIHAQYNGKHISFFKYNSHHLFVRIKVGPPYS